MPPSKRNKSATLAKLSPGSPIQLITKRSCQQTPKAFSSSLPLLIPLCPTKAISTTTPTAFNSSQVDKSEFKKKRRAQVISESESEESKKKKR
jgi:hypothetical protein